MCKSTECSNIIIVVKTTIRKKVAEKLDNPLITPKAYWPILFWRETKFQIFHR